MGIDRLAVALRAQELDRAFDVNYDNRLDVFDRDYLVLYRIRSTFGDANLDGVIDSRDLVQVFQFGQFEAPAIVESEWLAGDWNGDGRFCTSDLVLAFQTGSYITAARSDTAWARLELELFDAAIDSEMRRLSKSAP